MCGTGHHIPSSDAYYDPYCRLFPIDLPLVAEALSAIGATSPAPVMACFPAELEGYCVLALLQVAHDAKQWAGASRMSIERLERRLGWCYERSVWRRIGRWFISRGWRAELTKAELDDWWSRSFHDRFWESMERLIDRGFVSVEERLIHDATWNVYFPTDQLAGALSAQLTTVQPTTQGQSVPALCGISSTDIENPPSVP